MRTAATAANKKEQHDVIPNFDGAPTPAQA